MDCPNGPNIITKVFNSGGGSQKKSGSVRRTQPHVADFENRGMEESLKMEERGSRGESEEQKWLFKHGQNNALWERLDQPLLALNMDEAHEPLETGKGKKTDSPQCPADTLILAQWDYQPKKLYKNKFVLFQATKFEGYDSHRKLILGW